jgi:hypothetical protein
MLGPGLLGSRWPQPSVLLARIDGDAAKEAEVSTGRGWLKGNKDVVIEWISLCRRMLPPRNCITLVKIPENHGARAAECSSSGRAHADTAWRAP